MIKVSAVKFSWDLKQLPAAQPKMSHPMDLRLAEPGEEEGIWTTLERSLMSDPSWTMGLKARLDELRLVVNRGFSEKQVEFLVLEDGNRFIGVSGLLADPVQQRQLLTGVHILNEYRCRGAGSVLLHASLKHLKEKGLSEASVVTRANIAASRFLYPKFGSRKETLAEAPGIPQFSKVRA